MAHGDAREGKWRGNWRMECVASTLHTTSEHGVSSITTADAHTSAVSSRLNWRPPPDLNGLVRLRRKTKSGFCACAITFQTQSTAYCKIRTNMIAFPSIGIIGSRNIIFNKLKYEIIYQLEAVEYIFVFFQLDMFWANTPIFRSNGCYNTQHATSTHTPQDRHLTTPRTPYAAYVKEIITSIAPEDGRISPKHVELKEHKYILNCIKLVNYFLW